MPEGVKILSVIVPYANLNKAGCTRVVPPVQKFGGY